MEEQAKVPDVPPMDWKALMPGFLGIAAAAAGWLSSWIQKPVDPRLLNYVIGAHEHFAGAMVALHNGEFRLAKSALKTSEFFADMGLCLVPEHTIALPRDIPANDDGHIVLRHDADIARWRDWMQLEQSAFDRMLAMRPGAFRCDLCYSRPCLPNVRYCEQCRVRACEKLASPEALEDYLATQLIEVDLKRKEAEAPKDDLPSPVAE